jgi:hypothetical protein
MLSVVQNKLILYQELNVLSVKTMEVNAVLISQLLATTKTSFADQDTMLLTTWVKLVSDVKMMMNLSAACLSSLLAETKMSNVMTTKDQENLKLFVKEQNVATTLQLVVLMLLTLALTKPLSAEQVTTKLTTQKLFVLMQDV